jgi:glycosyltransferase involved in cell wall biosynthesis
MVDRATRNGRKSIIHVITQFDRGGSALNTFLTVLGHDRTQFRIGLAYGRARGRTPEEEARIENDVKELRSAGIALFEIPSLVREVRPFRDMYATLALWRLFRRERPALVHTHTSKAGAVGRIAAWLARVPAVIHTPHGHVFYGYYGRMMSEAIRLVEQALAQITHRIITLTERGAQEHVEYKIAGPEKFMTIPSGIVLSDFRSVRVDPKMKRKELGLPTEGPVIGTVGRLVPIKGHVWLLKAAPQVLAEFPGACFVFIGGGPLLEELKRSAEELGIGRCVVFLGPRQDMPECLAALDVFALPSLNEGMGRVLIEAMAVGVPIVATRVGGIPDIVADGATGMLVPPQDEKALAAALLELLRDPHRRRAYGEAARRSVDDRFDVASMVKEIERLYDAVWQEKQ